VPECIVRGSNPQAAVIRTLNHLFAQRERTICVSAADIHDRPYGLSSNSNSRDRDRLNERQA
jgi:hypothetical protein